jgi:hypothetical protein
LREILTNYLLYVEKKTIGTVMLQERAEES